MLISDVVYVFCNLIALYGMHLFCEKCFPEGGQRWLRRLALLLFLGIDFLLYLTISIPYLFPVFGFLTYFGLTAAYSRRISHKNFLAALLFLAFGICSELLASYLVALFMGLMGREHPENALIAALFTARLLFFCMLLLATRLIRYQKGAGVMPPISALTLFLPALSIGLVLYIFSLAEFDQHTILSAGSLGAIVSVLAILWINLVTFWLFDRQFQAYQMERETSALRMTIQVQQEHYNGEMEKREEIRKIRHDYKNFLLALQADIASGHTGEALSAIADELKGDFMNSLPQSGLYALDAIVGYKAAMADRQGIRLLPDYHMSGEPGISSEDVCVMIGNGLDNAMEYLRANPQCRQEILLRVVYEKGVLGVKIRNQVSTPPPIRDGRRIPTTKEGEGHGVGLKSIDYVAQKHNGRLILTCQGHTFECGIILYC